MSKLIAVAALVSASGLDSGMVWAESLVVAGSTTATAASGAAPEPPPAVRTSTSIATGPEAAAPPNELELLLDTPFTVWTASRMRESIREAPAAIEVITAADIEAWGYRSVGEAISHLLGFYLLDDHTIPNLAVRGISGGLGADSSIIKLMIDGHPIAFRATSGAWLGPELIPIGIVDRIEVVRGPASAVYGADAFLGVVNVITKDVGAREVELRGAGVNTGGRWGGTFDAHAAGTLGPLAVLLAAAGEYTDRSGMRLPGSSPAPIIPLYNADRVFGQGLIHDSNAYFAKMSFTPSGSALKELRLEGKYSELRRGGDFARWSQLSYTDDRVPGGARTLIALQEHDLALHGEFALTREVTLTANVAQFGGAPLDSDRIEVASDVFYVKRRFSFQGANGDLELRYTPVDDVVVATGVEYLFDAERIDIPVRVLRDRGSTIQDPAGTQTRQNFSNLGVFLRGQWRQAWAPLKLAGGLRYDENSPYGGQLSGRGAATLDFGQVFFLKLLYGSAFKAPSPLLLYADPLAPGDVIGNAKLEPQRVHTFELKASYVISRNLEVSSDAAYSFLFNKTEFMPQGINRVAQNVAEVRSLSLENRVDVLFPHWKAYAGVDVELARIQRQEDDYESVLVGAQNVIYPPWSVRAGAQASMPLRDMELTAALDGAMYGPRRASDTNILERGQSYTLAAYPTLGASLGLTGVDVGAGHASVFLRMLNALDNRTPDPGFSGYDYPRTRREAWLEGRLRF